MRMQWNKSSFLKMFLAFAVFGTVSAYESSQCLTTPDAAYNGTILNCSNTGMSAKSIGTLKFPNITTLIISNNNIQKLVNNSFLQFSHLKRLECEMCKLNFLEVDALAGMTELEILLLGRNYLRLEYHAFPFGSFRHVPQLKILHLDQNDSKGNATSYSKFIDIFDSLPKLTNLAIDSFRNLTIGEEFSRLKYLNSLEISCKNLENVNNDSLRGFQKSTVKHFTLRNSSTHLYDEEDCDMLFQFLPNISSLRIENVKFGNRKLLRMLKPLETMEKLDLLYIDNVGLYLTRQRNVRKRVQDRLFYSDTVQSLKNVCIEKFVWLNNYAILTDLEELTSGKWKYCLRSLTMVTGGSIDFVNHVYLYQLMRLRNLENFIFMVEHRKVVSNFWEVSTNLGISKTDEHGVVYKDVRECNGDWPRSITNLSKSLIEGHNCKKYSLSKSGLADSHDSEGSDSIQRIFRFKRRKSFLQSLNSMNVFVPPNLTQIVFDHSVRFDINRNVYIQNNTIRSVYIRRLRYHCNLNGRVLGLDSLEIIDLTGTPITGDPTFFKWFPVLRKLVLEHTQQTSTYYSQVAESAARMEYFDIANNNLDWLPTRMFDSNSHLRYLSLASNRFGMFPFDIGLTPHLEILDLRKNSIVLTPKDILAINNHHRHHTRPFTLLFSENQIACTCSALPFLQWLQYTTIDLDNDGNYTCVTDDGTLSYTAFFGDIKAFRRKCHGRSYFLVSLILLSSMAAIYMGAFLGIKHKTQILSSMMQLMIPGFKLKTRNDFNFDVVIGYANQDADFIRTVLLRYLEDMWHLKTFVHQRDLLHDPLLMSQAIRDSWRNLLLITEDFLDRHHMAHNIMKVCTFFVHPSNPRSVIVMVEESVRHRIPDYVLQVVDEDNIIVLSSLQGWLDYETKETLKTRIF